MDLKGIVFAVDFDGTCVTHDYPLVGSEIGATPVLKRMTAAGAKLILWTMRSGDELEHAVQWFEARDIELYGVQRNPTQDSWTTSPKAYAHKYIDDAAVGCPLVYPTDSGWASPLRPFVDWVAMEKTIFGGTGQ